MHQETHDYRHARNATGFIFAVLTVIFCVLICRVVQINTTMAPRLRAIAAAQQENTTIIPARRGMIVDSHGRVLAGSELRASVFADPGLIDDPQQVATQMAPILDMSPTEIERLIRTSNAPRFCWIKRRIEKVQVDAIKALGFAGIGFSDEFRRRWPMNELAAQVVGFVGGDEQGLAGMELLYDNHLRGTDGRRSTLRDARRRPIGPGRRGMVAPQDGGHLVLTIDAVVQENVERELAEQIEEFKAESGIAIVMCPKSGDILAMACYPSFDLNRFNHTSRTLWRNRAVTDPVEPGSTFKPFIMAGALEAGFVNPNEIIDCHNGVHYFGRRRIRDTSPHGALSPKEIIVYSSNIGMGIIGTRMGDEALYEAVTRFGFGSITQVGFPGEDRGIVLPTKRWSGYSKTSVPMGQELAITPIQLITAFASIANGGVLVRPRLVHAMLNAEGDVVKSFDDPEAIRRVMPIAVSKYMVQEALAGVVQRGGKELDAGEYTMFGKTGTAQIPSKNSRGYEPNAYLSSFVGGAPVEDPQLVALVMIRKPDRSIGHYGRVVAGPAVRDIISTSLRYLEVPSSATITSEFASTR